MVREIRGVQVALFPEANNKCRLKSVSPFSRTCKEDQNLLLEVRVKGSTKFTRVSCRGGW